MDFCLLFTAIIEFCLKPKKVKEDGGCIDVLKMYCGHQWWNQSLDSRVWGHNTFPRIFIRSTYGVFPYICHLNHHFSS